MGIIIKSRETSWCREQTDREFKVVILYASAYGNTATVASAIAHGLVESGVEVESINCELASTEEIATAIDTCDGFIIGSPTLGGHAPTQVQTALGIVMANAAKTKLAGVFGSYGWSGEAIAIWQVSDLACLPKLTPETDRVVNFL